MAIQAGVSPPGGRGAAEVARPAGGARQRSRSRRPGVRGGGGRSRSRVAGGIDHVARRRRRAPRGARRAREPRGVGHSLRRPAHAAHGDVHRAVRDVDRRHVEVQGPVDRLQRGARRRQARRRCSRARTRKDNSPIPGNGYGSGPASGGSLVDEQEHPHRVAAHAAAQRDAAAREREGQGSRSRSTKVQQRDRRARASAAGFGKSIHTELQSQGLQVTVVTDKVLFDSGSAELRSEGAPLLALVAKALKAVPNPVLIDGYTDNVPIATAQYPSNLFLSAPGPRGRASTSRRSGSTRPGSSRPGSATRTRSRRTARPPGARATGGSRSSCSRRS